MLWWRAGALLLILTILHNKLASTLSMVSLNSAVLARLRQREQVVARRSIPRRRQWWWTTRAPPKTSLERAKTAFAVPNTRISYIFQSWSERLDRTESKSLKVTSSWRSKASVLIPFRTIALPVLKFETRHYHQNIPYWLTRNCN